MAKTLGTIAGLLSWMLVVPGALAAPEDICPGGASPRGDVVLCVDFDDNTSNVCDSAGGPYNATCLSNNNFTGTYNYMTIGQGGAAAGTARAVAFPEPGTTGAGYVDYALNGGTGYKYCRERYYIKYGDNFMTYSAHHGPSIRGSGGGCSIGGTLEISQFGYYGYHTATGCPNSDYHIYTKETGAPLLKNGKWYRIEIERLVDTDGTDGSTKYWIDGTLVLSQTGKNYGGSSLGVKWNYAYGPRDYFHVTHPDNNSIEFDNFVVACSDTTPPTTIGAASNEAGDLGTEDTEEIGVVYTPGWGFAYTSSTAARHVKTDFSGSTYKNLNYSLSPIGSLYSYDFAPTPAHNGIEDWGVLAGQPAVTNGSMKITAPTDSGPRGQAFQVWTSTIPAYTPNTMHLGGWMWLDSANDYSANEAIIGVTGEKSGPAPSSQDPWGRYTAIAINNGHWAIVQRYRPGSNVEDTPTVVAESAVNVIEDRWIEYEFSVNVSAQTVSLWVDGVQVFENEAVSKTIPMERIVTGIIDQSSGSDMIMYIDDMWVATKSLRTRSGLPDVGCGRDTNMDGSIDNLCPGDDQDNDGYTVAQGDCDDTDYDIWPGASWMGAKAGCSPGYWRTCKADGSGWGSCTDDSSSHWCPSSSTTTTTQGAVALNCIYLSPAGSNSTGDGSWGNPYRTLEKFTTGAAGRVQLDAGDAVILLPGAYTQTTNSYVIQDDGSNNYEGTATNRIWVVGYPHYDRTDYPILNHPVQSYLTSYVVVQNLEVQTEQNRTVDYLAGIHINEGTYSVVRGNYVHDITRRGNDNIGGIVITAGGVGHDISRNYVTSAYQYGRLVDSVYRGVGILAYRIDDTDVQYNTLVSDGWTRTIAAIQEKHLNYNTTANHNGNYIYGWHFGFDLNGGNGRTLDYNLLSDIDDGVVLRDVGGPGQWGNTTIQYNTFNLSSTSRAIAVPVTKRYNQANTDSGTDCGADTPTWSDSYFRYNIVYSPDTTFEYQQHGAYKPDDLISPWQSHWVSDYNGVYSADTTPVVEWFSTGSSCGATCGGCEDGTSYSSWSAIQASGIESNSTWGDPIFDALLMPSHEDMTAWGYRAILVGGGSDSLNAAGRRPPFRRLF